MIIGKFKPYIVLGYGYGLKLGDSIGIRDEKAIGSEYDSPLENSGWKIYGAWETAEILGIKPTTLSSKIK